MLSTRAHSHKETSSQRRGLGRGSEGAEQLLTQLVAFALVRNIFLLPPVCSSSTHQTKLPVYRERTPYTCSSLFCVHKSTFSLEQLFIAPVTLSRGSSSFYGFQEKHRNEANIRGCGKTVHVVFKNICPDTCYRKGWRADGVRPPTLITTL